MHISNDFLKSSFVCVCVCCVYGSEGLAIIGFVLNLEVGGWKFLVDKVGKS